MNLQTTHNPLFPAGLSDRMPGLLPPYASPSKKKGARGPEHHDPEHRGPEHHGPAHQDALDTNTSDLVEQGGLGAMTGLGVAMMFNAGLALAGLVGWELWLMLH
jgi:hypothetical protein